MMKRFLTIALLACCCLLNHLAMARINIAPRLEDPEESIDSLLLNHPVLRISDSIQGYRFRIPANGGEVCTANNAVKAQN